MIAWRAAVERPFLRRQIHKFKVGQMLEIVPVPSTTMRPGLCEVIAVLPFEGGYLQYRVKSVSETNERIVNEGDLRKSNARAPNESTRIALPNVRISSRKDR